MASNKPIVIAFTGYAGSGKDTVCTLMKNNLVGSVEVMRFADALKRIVQVLYPTLPPDAPYTQAGKEMTLPNSFMSVRSLLQGLGAEVMRAQDPEVWVKNLERRIEASTAKYVLVPDLRFINEAEMIKRLGGKIVWVWREGIKVMDHISETEMMTQIETLADVKIPDSSLAQLPNYAQAVADFFELDWTTSSVLDQVIGLSLGDKTVQETKNKVLELMVKMLPITKMELLKPRLPVKVDPPLVVFEKPKPKNTPIATMSFYELLAYQNRKAKAIAEPEEPDEMNFYS